MTDLGLQKDERRAGNGPPIPLTIPEVQNRRREGFPDGRAQIERPVGLDMYPGIVPRMLTVTCQADSMVRRKELNGPGDRTIPVPQRFGHVALGPQASVERVPVHGTDPRGRADIPQNMTVPVAGGLEGDVAHRLSATVPLIRNGGEGGIAPQRVTVPDVTDPDMVDTRRQTAAPPADIVPGEGLTVGTEGTIVVPVIGTRITEPLG